MKKLLLALTAMSILGLTSVFAGEACKKCSGADKNATCTCPKDKSSCDKDKGSCDKDKAASDKASTETKK